MTKAILLVGGFGTRLKPLTNNVPKPMLPLAGLPVTEHQIIAAQNAGITELVLATAYLSEVFTPYFGDGSQWGMKLSYAIEKEPMGTGGAIRNAFDSFTSVGENEKIVIFNGDVISSHNLAKQLEFHDEKGAGVTLHLVEVTDARKFGCVPIGDDGRVLDFLEKMDNPISNVINAGCYVFSASVIKSIPQNQVISVERETFPGLLRDGVKIYGFLDNSYWLDVGTPEALIKGSRDIVTGEANSSALDGVPTSVRTSQAIALGDCEIGEGVQLIDGTSLGRGVRVAAGARVSGSIICDGVSIGAGTTIDQSFIAAGTEIGENRKYFRVFIDKNGEIPLNFSA